MNNHNTISSQKQMQSWSEEILRDIGKYASSMRYCKYRRQIVVRICLLNHSFLLSLQSPMLIPELMIMVVTLRDGGLMKYLQTSDGTIQYTVFHNHTETIPENQDAFSIPRMYYTNVA